MPQFEYARLESYSSSDEGFCPITDSQLNGLGADGWEMVAGQFDNGNALMVAVFKRIKPTPADSTSVPESTHTDWPTDVASLQYISQWPNLSVRARRVLNTLNITTLAQLQSTIDMAFIDVHNCGLATLEHIREKQQIAELRITEAQHLATEPPTQER
jgi:DNA-directed RNA polymerase alpha subunit